MQCARVQCGPPDIEVCCAMNVLGTRVPSQASSHSHTAVWRNLPVRRRVARLWNDASQSAVAAAHHTATGGCGWRE